MKIKEKPKQLCDRCGNDLMFGDFMIHLPYKNIYIHLCHVCNQGMMYGFWRDLTLEQGNLKKQYG